MIIKDVRARQILDSRGNPTIEVDVVTDAAVGRASVPSGASKGKHEAAELRDGGDAYGGLSVRNAVRNVNETIGPKLEGRDTSDQKLLDGMMVEMDGTPDKSKLGANAILGCSLAVAKAAASSRKVPLYQHLNPLNRYFLPVPAMNVINGGAHAGNDLDIQEHMIFPTGASSFAEAARMCSETYHLLGEMLKQKYGNSSTNLGDEGGYAPPLKDPREPLDLIVASIDKAGYGGKVKMALDAAATGFYSDGRYTIQGKDYSPEELVDFYKDLVSTYPIISIEDGFAEDDWDGFALMTKELDIQIIGDDLFTTNIERLNTGIEKGACNCLLLKPNQIGTLTEATETCKAAFKNGYGVMASHRSGETEDTFLSDLVVALGAGQIKSGAPARGERTGKYNQLLRIEEELGPKGIYAGENFRHPE